MTRGLGLPALSAAALLLLCISPLVLAARYRYLSYGGINRRLRLLAASHSDVLSIYSADKHLNVPTTGLCRSSIASRPSGRPDQPCEMLIADIGPRAAPAVLVLGSLHGDERLGSIAALALVETLVLRTGDEWLMRLVRNRRIIVVPMPNPSAYDKFTRYEPGPNGTLIDAAADFPFVRDGSSSVVPGSCLRSTAARAVHALFGRHLFRIAVALHSRREFIGYSWGSDREEFCIRAPPRNNATVASSGSAFGVAGMASLVTGPTGSRNLEDLDYDDDGDPDCAFGWSTPDAVMLSDIARKMASFAGTSPTGAAYDSGALNDPRIAAPVSGGFADYAYASSFRPDLVAACAQRGTTPVSNVSHRAAALIFETSRETAPSERALGSDRSLYRVKKGGIIPRILRGLLLAVDVARPYAFFTAERRPRVGRGGILRAQWSVGGAVTVDRTYLQITVGLDGVPFFSSNQSGSSMWGQPFDDAPVADSLFARLQRRRRIDRFVYDDAVLLYRYLTPEQRQHGTSLSVRAVAHVDGGWAFAPSNSTGAHAPVSGTFEPATDGQVQSHLARSRTDSNWRVEHAGVAIGYEGIVMSESVEIGVPPLSGWLVWRDLAFISILLCVVPPAVLLSCLRRSGKLAVGPSSRSLARLRIRQLRRAQGWFRNSSKSAIVADIAEIQRLRGRTTEAP